MYLPKVISEPGRGTLDYVLFKKEKADTKNGYGMLT